MTINRQKFTVEFKRDAATLVAVSNGTPYWKPTAQRG
jgi:hypothetical protein